jgi:hypothetical protein
MVDELMNTEEMQNQLHKILQEKFGKNNGSKLEGGKRKSAGASKKASKSHIEALEGGKRKKASKKASKKAGKK